MCFMRNKCLDNKFFEDNIFLFCVSNRLYYLIKSLLFEKIQCRKMGNR